MKTTNHFSMLMVLIISARTLASCTKEAERGPTTVAGQVLLRASRPPSDTQQVRIAC